MDHSPRSHRDDRGVVALELVLVLPFLIALLMAIVAFAGLFQTKSRVVNAARDGARALALSLPDPDRNTSDAITVVREGPPCPPLTDTAYQSANPPQVTAKASTTYTVDAFIYTWDDVPVTERATMPCG